MRKIGISFAAVSCAVVFSCTVSANVRPAEVVMESDRVVVYNAPSEESLNTKYKVSVDGLQVPVYNARVGCEDRTKRHRAMDVLAESSSLYDIAGFAYFDLKRGPVTVTVTVNENIREAKILPSSYGITPLIEGNTLTFQADRPYNLTVDINGDYVRSLHIFVNEEETDAPDPEDPNVIYFGPGVHEVTSLEVGDNKTVYIAGGAVVRGIMGDNEPSRTNSRTGMRNFPTPTFALRGKNITFRGRGIFDQSNCTPHARNMLVANGEDIKIEGVIFHNSSHWSIPVRSSDRVHIDNIKLITHRANADGIDICASHNVLVENCFLRTLDDLIVVKSLKGTGDVKNITARKCVLWNEVAHALSIGAEITSPVEDVTFIDCDVIHDHCREWTLRVYQTDSGLVKNVRFENIRIEQSVRFASLWIGEAIWTTDAERIRNVVFKDIEAVGANPLKAEFKGFDEDHAVRNVLLENIKLNGKMLSREDVIANEYVYDVEIR